MRGSTTNLGSLVCSLPLQWRPFNIAFSSVFSRETRLAICSFEKGQQNCVSILRMVGPSILLESTGIVPLPQTHIQFSPFGSSDSSDTFITCAESLRVWRVIPSANNDSFLQNIAIIPTENMLEPITSSDWSSISENLVISGTTAGTVAIMDLSVQSMVSRVIAHDHQVHDVKFFGPTPTFVTAGFDGSVRFFDFREMSTSFIYYQSPNPLLRIAIPPYDSPKFATFAAGSKNVTVIDTRNPGIPCGVVHHDGEGSITTAQWSKACRDRLITGDTAGNIFASNINDTSLRPQSSLFHQATSAIQAMTIGQGISALALKNSVDIVKLAVPENLASQTEETDQTNPFPIMDY